MKIYECKCGDVRCSQEKALLGTKWVISCRCGKRVEGKTLEKAVEKWNDTLTNLKLDTDDNTAVKKNKRNGIRNGE